MSLESAVLLSNRFEYLLNKASATGAILSVIVGSATIALMISTLFGAEDSTKPIPENIEARLAKLDQTIETLSREDQRKYVDAGTISVGRIEIIEGKQNAIEEALQNDVGRALSVAMLRRDLDELKTTNQQRVENLEERLESLYTLLLWIAGTMVTIFLAFLGVLGLRGTGQTNT